MTSHRTASKRLTLLVVLMMAFSILMPLAGDRIQAQGTPIVVSVPALWEDMLTPELLGEFEAQYGVDVIVTFDETPFFGFGGATTAIDDSLDATEELVNSADVIYIDQTSLTAADTQAGYFLDLAPLVMNDPVLNVADFVPAAWESCQWDNGIWALPLSIDVILLTYDPVAFDEAGLAYPNERWTADDFANAARRLAVYNADGTVDTAGFTTVAGGNNLNLFLRALAGSGFYDPTTLPNAPQFSDPNLEYALQVFHDLMQEGVVQVQGGGLDQDIPLRVGGINSYADRGGFGGNNANDTVFYATLLPGGVAGLSVQGFAVSAGTQYPEVAYALAGFLTMQPALTSNPFSAAPARISLVGVEVANGNGDPGGPGGGPGGEFGFNRTIPETIQPTVDQGMAAALPLAELRYASYLNTALTDMNTNGTDARSALQGAEAQAISDMNTAMARNGTVSLAVVPPATGPVLAPGEISLTCGLNLGIGGRFRQAQLPNQAEWDQVIADFVAADPLVGAVVIETTPEQDLAALAETYDCFILPSNAVEGSDVSPVLSLDPLIDADPSFDRNDVIGNTLIQLQQDNKTWALPLAIEPQMLQYDPEQFARAGVPEPFNGWTTDAFSDALRVLKPYDTDPAPFAPNDPSGSYLMMLIAAYGGLPFDYRIDPATINFTDPATVDAIRQVLDLAADGYIAYSALTNVVEEATTLLIDGTESSAITTNTLSQFNFPGGPGGPNNTSTVDPVMTLYPQGSQYGVIAYEITTGYISATTQNPDATYRFLSAVASSPELFSGMPARQSLVNDPAVVAAQGAEVVAVYQQLDALLRGPNTVVFPSFTQGRGGGALSFIEQFWLYRAMDRYVLEGADLGYELAEAEMFTLAYRECAEGFVAEAGSAVEGQQFQFFEQISQCATSVDPTFTLGF